MHLDLHRFEVSNELAQYLTCPICKQILLNVESFENHLKNAVEKGFRPCGKKVGDAIKVKLALGSQSNPPKKLCKNARVERIYPCVFCVAWIYNLELSFEHQVTKQEI